MTTASAPPAPTPPQVLFVGDDASSPQIAASLLRRLAGDRVGVDTAGTTAIEPGGRSDEMLVAMGLNPAGEQRLSARALHAADRVVVLGAGLDVAQLPGPRYQEWDLSHDDLIERVQGLSDELSAVPEQRPHSMLDRLRMLLRAVRHR
jgi:hypothetical protein